MKLAHAGYNLILEWEENKIPILVIENTTVYVELIQELYRQCQGEIGRFVFSDNQKILNLNKTAEMIIDLFCINCNTKQMLGKLYQEIDELANEKLLLEGIELHTVVMRYMEAALELVPYHLCYKSELCSSNVLKMMELKFEKEATTLLERVVEYLNVKSKLHENGITIFVNLKLFLSLDELKNLYEYVFYNKIRVVLIEGRTGEILSEEKVVVIDKDQCVIYL